MAKSLTKKILYRTNIGRQYLRYKFHKPDKRRPRIELDNEYEALSKEFNSNGVVRLDGFEDIADYLLEHYVDPSETVSNSTEPFFKVLGGERYSKGGRTLNMKMSFGDENLKDLYFNKNLLGIIYNYYKRQPFYRNLPAISKVEFKEGEHSADMQGKFHLDNGLNQISIMLLLKDIGMSDTHMEYALGSNTDPLPEDLDRNSWTDDSINEKYDIVHLIGKKGTLWLFDAGNGYHRARYYDQSVRIILHCNLTVGHTLVGDSDNGDFSFLKNEEQFITNTIKKLLL